MSTLSFGIVGIAAAAAALGAATHFEQALGREADTTVMLRDAGQIPQAAPAPAFDHGVNRAAKADRIAAPQLSASYQTVELSIAGLPATSVLVRMPAPAGPAIKRPPAQEQRPPDGTARRLIACEPVASIMTDAGRSGLIGSCLA